MHTTLNYLSPLKFESVNLPETDAPPNTLGSVRNIGGEQFRKPKLQLLSVTEVGLAHVMSIYLLTCGQEE